jgi:hypothetical protein
MSKTYILIADHKPGIDLVTERWEADDRWVVGERRHDTGATDFYHRTEESLDAMCDRFGVAKAEVVRRDADKIRPKPVAGDMAVKTYKEVGWAYPTSERAREFKRERTGCFTVNVVSFSIPSGAIVRGEHLGPFDTREEAVAIAATRPEAWAAWTKEGGYVSPFAKPAESEGVVADGANSAPLPVAASSASRKSA